MYYIYVYYQYIPNTPVPYVAHSSIMYYYLML